MEPGEICYVRYHGDPGVVHTRLLLGLVEGNEWLICTPDHDIYVEEMHPQNPDFHNFWHTQDGRVPRGVPAGQVYAFAPLSARELARINAAGRAELQAERARRGLGAAAPGGGAGAPAAAAAPAPVPMVVAPVALAGGGAPDAPVVQYAPDTLYWLAAEDGGGFKFGDAVPAVLVAAAEGLKVVHSLPGGSIFCECVRASERPSFLQRPARWDQRIVPVTLDALGKPDCSLKEVAQKCSEQAVQWSLPGPRTAKWCLAYLSAEGLGLEGHHERFRQLVKADSSSWGVAEHFQLSMILKAALQQDQVDGYNNLFIEILFRRLQTIEYSYSEKAKEIEAKAAGGRLSLEEQQTFGGLMRQASTLMVCPDLLTHVKTEVERDATLAKNLRKAREERELLRKKKGGKGGDDAS